MNKLTLSKETLKQLNAADTLEVAGGVYTKPIDKCEAQHRNSWYCNDTVFNCDSIHQVCISIAVNSACI